MSHLLRCARLLPRAGHRPQGPQGDQTHNGVHAPQKGTQTVTDTHALDTICSLKICCW